MRIDLYTKTLLTIIAGSLAVIACRPLLPSLVQASDGPPIERIADKVTSIDRYLQGIARGEYPCRNKKLCP